MVDPAFKREVFNLVRARLVDRSDSLIRFFKHWHGSASGIEGWFKLEFVAAIEPHVADVYTGSAGGWGRVGTSYPDLILKPPQGIAVPVETKGAGSQFHFGGGAVAQMYRGRLLAFITRSLLPIKPAHEEKVRKLDADMQIARICDVSDAKSCCALYFGMADLTGAGTEPIAAGEAGLRQVHTSVNLSYLTP